MNHGLPANIHITYQLQYRKCGHEHCCTCCNGRGHGPYWYAYWREEGRLRSRYLGKMPPVALTPHAIEEAMQRVMYVAVVGEPPPRQASI